MWIPVRRDCAIAPLVSLQKARASHLFVNCGRACQEARAFRQFYFVPPGYFMTFSAGDDETNYL